MKMSAPLALLLFAVCFTLSARERFLKSGLPPRVIKLDASQELTISRQAGQDDRTLARDLLLICCASGTARFDDVRLEEVKEEK